MDTGIFLFYEQKPYFLHFSIKLSQTRGKVLKNDAILTPLRNIDFRSILSIVSIFFDGLLYILF